MFTPNSLEARIKALEEQAMTFTTSATVKEMIRSSIYQPLLDNPSLPEDAPFMRYSSWHVSDLMHPRYVQLCKLINARPIWHRKVGIHFHHPSLAGTWRTPGRKEGHRLRGGA